MSRYEAYKREGCAHGFSEKICPAATRQCAYQRGECEERSDITFWLDEKGMMLDSTLPSENRFMLFLQLILVTLPWMAAAALSALAWKLVLPDGFTFDTFAIGTVLSFLSFFAVGYWSATDAKRTAGASAFISLSSACKNFTATLANSVDVKKLSANPEVEMLMHNSQAYVLVQVPALAVVKWIGVTCAGLLAAQRNAIRSEVKIRKLPIYNPQKAELEAEAANIDVLEQMQGMIMRYWGVLFDAGLIDNDKWHQAFYKDKIDSLGNIDIGGKIGVSAVNGVFSMFVRILATVLVPWQLVGLFPGFSAVWISPLVLFFYYALFEIGDRQAKIAVTQEDNWWTSIKLTEEMRTGAQTCFARSMQIARMVASTQQAKRNKVSMPEAPPDVIPTQAVGPSNISAPPVSSPFTDHKRAVASKQPATPSGDSFFDL